MNTQDKTAHKKHKKVQNGGIITMRKRKGNLLQRIMASMLSAVLIAGMVLDAVPLTVLAQENSGGGYNVTRHFVVDGKSILFSTV